VHHKMSVRDPVALSVDRGTHPVGHRISRDRRNALHPPTGRLRRETTLKATLAEAGSEMRLKTIHAEVERVLGGSVSFQSVADY
jgi:hypothetical protein